MPMSLEQHALLKLMEECGEVAQRASKAMQFGPYDVQQGKTENNEERLMCELMDLMSSIDTLEVTFGYRFPKPEIYDKHLKDKQIKVNKYLIYSQGLGFVSYK